MSLVNEQSALRYQGNDGPVYWGEKDFAEYYFTEDKKIYSDKISKFVFNCNLRSNNAVIDRISKIYDFIFIDEVQDLAGFDLELLKLLFQSTSSILLVGDPRQVTYLTHNSRKHNKYSDGNIKEFIEKELGKKIKFIVDEDTLKTSHRNNQSICDFSGKLYPRLPTPTPCVCPSCRKYIEEHEGIYLVKKKDVDYYLQKYKPVQLRWSATIKVNQQYDFMNLGASKGLTFDSTMIYPTKDMKKWIENNAYNLKNEARAKFYVGVTRARYSVGIVMDFEDNGTYIGVKKFSIKDEK